MFPRKTGVGAAGCIYEEAIEDRYLKPRKARSLWSFHVLGAYVHVARAPARPLIQNSEHGQAALGTAQHAAKSAWVHPCAAYRGMSGERFILWYVDSTVALCSLVKGMSREVYIPMILIGCKSSCTGFVEHVHLRNPMVDGWTSFGVSLPTEQCRCYPEVRVSATHLVQVAAGPSTSTSKLGN